MEALFDALLNLLDPTHFLFLFGGTVLGLIVGVLPGLGGSAGLALLIPFVFGMEPSYALAMMIGLLAPTTTSDTFPAVLMGIPGTSGSQATVMDGFPLAKKGEGARALAAAFTASLFGGLFGAVVLTGAVFVAVPIILSIGFGEQLLLVILGLTMIGLLTGRNPIKGLASCGIGLMIGVIGAAPATGDGRITFGQNYLYDGIPIVIMGLGMFAMPEIIDLLRRHSKIAETQKMGSGWYRGFKDAMRNKWLMVRCSSIGCIIGALPGLGGSVVDWIAYGHVIQTSRKRDQFGEGDIRGVIAPESANNAKEGGALIPTLLFGIPGSGSMAILLGGFVTVGVQPGVSMVTTDLDLTYTMIWSLALANVIGAGICLALAGPISQLTRVPYVLLGPVMLVLIFFAAFQATRDWGDLLALLAVGTLGCYMKRFGWSRPALLIGFFLAMRIEQSTYRAIQVYGLSFFERPQALVILALLLISLVAAIMFKPSKLRGDDLARFHSSRTWPPQVAMTLIFIAFAVVVFLDGLGQRYLAMIFPIAISIITVLLLLPVLLQQLLLRHPHTAFADMDAGHAADARSIPHYLLWILGLLGSIAVLGFPIGMTAFILAFTTVKGGVHLIRNGAITAAAFLALSGLSAALTLRYPPGLLQRVVEMPWWLGG
ncbi:MAG: tripartite tricarboxylate transporter permease [Azospirillaceae bacterium]